MPDMQIASAQAHTESEPDWAGAQSQMHQGEPLPFVHIVHSVTQRFLRAK